MFHAIDVGNSDGKTAMEIAKVINYLVQL